MLQGIVASAVKKPEPPDQCNGVLETLTGYTAFTLSVDGRFTGWNPGAERTFGYSLDEAIGKEYSLIFTPEDVARGRPEAELQGSLTSGYKPVAGEYLRKDSGRFTCAHALRPLRDAAGTLCGFMNIVCDSPDHDIAWEPLRESEERFRLLVESVTDYAIFSLSLDGTIVLWNSGAELTFGYTEAEAVGKHFSLIYTADAVAQGIPEAELSTAAQHGVASDEAWHVRRGGDLFYASGQMTRLKPGADGNPRGFVKIARDVTTRIEAYETIKRIAFYDQLTQLPNRTSFGEILQRSLARVAQQADDRFAVILIDLDRFKTINDSLGRVVADALLVQVARLIERSLRPDDVVARLGGNLFAVLLPEVSETSDATRIAELIEAELEHSMYLDGFEVYATASMGIVFGSAAHSDVEHVLADADTAMYEAKSQGRARSVVFDRTMHERALRLFTLQMDLRRALARREFFNEYQPIVSLDRGQVLGFEALVRWNHPERGVVGPSEFIAEAESIGLIVQIDRWVLREACRQLHAWQMQYDDDTLTVSVNFSSQQFARPDLLAEVRGALELNDLDPRSLKLEITETALMKDFEAMTAAAAELAALGVELYIDDFGTAYSSLSRLTRLPLKVLKIDRSFVSQISFDQRRVEVARTVVALAHNLDLTALAEGIETELQLDTLRALGCELGQGYWFSPPVAPEVAQHFIGRCLPLHVHATSSPLRSGDVLRHNSAKRSGSPRDA
jgi:diguanylate cyclase (GGDEF)-like protein/PAS domain S-box-containing protein